MDNEGKKELSVSEESLLPATKTDELKKESLDILNQIITSTDANKTKDLTCLFNENQNKKTMLRINKMNDLLDVITDQAMTRFTAKPDEISNKELLDSMKVVSELIDKGSKQINNVETPLIQINQQNNEVNMGDTKGGLNRESRERVKNTVNDLLASLGLTGMPNADKQPEPIAEDIIDVEAEDIEND
jgi:uncharacterized pyridoxal phosphate-containing UPF0001 family protein